MKKLFFVVCMALVSATSFAQQGKVTLGVHGDYMIDSPNNFGFGANVGYEFINNLRGTAEFNYLFKKDEASFWNLEADVAYLFRIPKSPVTLYPLVGADFLGIKVFDESESKMGLNIGAGIEVGITSNIGLRVEYNYKTEYDGWSLLKFGVVIPIN